MEWQEFHAGSAILAPARRIHGGTSGGPIVDSTGRLIGIIGDAQDRYLDDTDRHPHNVGDQTSTFRLLGSALPPWLAIHIEAAKDEQD